MRRRLVRDLGTFSSVMDAHLGHLGYLALGVLFALVYGLARDRPSAGVPAAIGWALTLVAGVAARRLWSRV